ncbi:MAG: alanine--glyoxylate aminotransferase family protein [Desulfobacterales bacterium]|nr:alanine--glyoxylate aminotransferase family protein [Desulfobacterales bacterium]
MGLNVNDFRYINPAQRILLGPGPSEVPPRVLQSMAAPCVGHLDPYFLAVMDETQHLLRFLFQTENALTISVPGTGTAGMEACLVNMLEPGDEAVICVHGAFGARMCEMVERIGGKLIRVDQQWGKSTDPEAVRKAVKGRGPKLLAVVHGETSTGVLQPLQDLSAIAREAGALFMVDMVTSLGGMDIALDREGIDVAYSGTQKCISCPPGLAPISFNDKAMKVLRGRRTPVLSWYLDMSLVENYWGPARKYHHTAPINMVYALRESLRIIADEGLEPRFARHKLNHRALVAGVEAMGLNMLVPEAERLPTLNAIKIPDGVDDLKVRKALLDEFGIEIGGGLGALAGKIWRVGLMGHSSTKRNVFIFLAAMQSILKAEGAKIKNGAIEAADAVYKKIS